MLKIISNFLNKSFWRQVNATVSKFEKSNFFVRKIAGLGLVILGIIGIILPILPGWIFLMPGLILLFPQFRK
jgi:preprotein translocase subunit Sss1